MKSHFSNHDKTLAEINVTPFVDVVLVLLIIFMITAPLLSQGLDVELPVAEAAALKRSEQDLIVTMRRDGRMYLMEDKTPYSLETIEIKLKQAFKHREKKDLLLRADRETPYGTVVQAIALFKKSGVERVGMVTEEPQLEKKAEKKPSKR